MKFLFDLGGVFFDWNPRFFYKQFFKKTDELDFFLTNICNDEWNLKQDAGRLIIDGEKELIEKFPNYESMIKLYYPNHRLMIKDTYKESIDLLNELKLKNYKCFVLSNWSEETYVGIEEIYPFLKKFDGKIISGVEKLVKPSLKIYQLAIKRFNLIPKNTIFIDDRKKNIESAEKLGFQTVHLTNPKIIKSKIYNFLKK